MFPANLFARLSSREIKESLRAAFAVGVWLVVVGGSIVSILWLIS
jgi:hypothetical protein